MKTPVRFLLPLIGFLLVAGCNNPPEEPSPEGYEPTYGAPEEVEETEVIYAEPYSNGPGDELPYVEGPTEGPPVD